MDAPTAAGLLVLLILAGKASFATGTSLDGVEATAKLLGSSKPSLVAAGARALEENGEVLWDVVFEKIRNGTMEERAVAAASAAIFLSPWSQSVAAAEAGDFVYPLRIRRPVGRHREDPRAPALRQALLTAIRDTHSLVNTPADEINSLPKEDFDALHGLSFPAEETLRQLCSCLTEVADDNAVSEVMELAGKTRSRFVTPTLMRVVSMVMGIPEAYRIEPGCITSSPAAYTQFEKAETGRMETGRDRLGESLNRWLPLSKNQRIEFAVEQWKERFGEPDFMGARLPPGAAGACLSRVREVLPLIRLGEPAIPFLDRLTKEAGEGAPPNRETPQLREGRVALVRAVITGETDAGLIERSLHSSEIVERRLGCDLIAVTASREWDGYLEVIVGFNNGGEEAAETLIAVKGPEAVTFLEEAVRWHRGNRMARLGIVRLNQEAAETRESAGNRRWRWQRQR